VLQASSWLHRGLFPLNLAPTPLNRQLSFELGLHLQVNLMALGFLQLKQLVLLLPQAGQVAKV